MKLPNTRWQKVVQVSLWNSINFVACSVSFTILMCTFSSVIAQREWETILQVNCLKCHPSGSLLHWMYVGHYSKFSCGVNSINKIFSVAIFLINIFLYNHYDNFISSIKWCDFISCLSISILVWIIQDTGCAIIFPVSRFFVDCYTKNIIDISQICQEQLFVQRIKEIKF